MKLKEWLIYTGRKRSDLARDLGIGGTYISSWMSGRKKPSSWIMAQIVQLTDGKVACYADLVNKYMDKARKKV